MLKDLSRRGHKPDRVRDRPQNHQAEVEAKIEPFKELLGSFEFRILRAIEALKEDAYGAEIGRHLSRELKRSVTAPQVYMTLSRLTKRGFVSFEETDPVPERGGRSRKRFSIEADGARALWKTSAALNAISQCEVDDATGAECPA